MYEDVLQGLFDEYGRANHAMRAVVDTAREEKRDLTGEEQQEFERVNAHLDDIEGRINTLKGRIQSDRQVDEMRANSEQWLRPEGSGDQPEADGGFERRMDDFVRGKAGNTIDVPLTGLVVETDSRGVKHVIEKRSGLVEGTPNVGGYTVPTGFRAVLYQHLIQNSAIRQTRATVLTTGTGEALLLPKTTAHPASGTIVSEAAGIGEADPVFGQGTLNAYKYANVIQVSNELLTDTAVDLLGYLAMAMGRALGNGSGADFITGSGSSKPHGIVGRAGTVAQVSGGTGIAGVATYAELEQLFDKIIPGYQANGEWLFSQTTLSKLRQLTDTLGRPLWLPSLSGGMPSTLFGKPYFVDPNMPNAGTSATSILFGDFSTYFIRDVSAVRVERSVDFAFDHDVVTYRAILRTDGDLLDLTGSIGNYKGGTA